MKIKHIYLLLSLVIISFLLLTAFTDMKNPGEESKKRNDKIIKFSHKTHMVAVECVVCHDNVNNAKSLDDRLLPKMSDCGECHDVTNKDQCEMCHYDKVYEPFSKKRVKLIFDHNFHLQKNLKCIDCHIGLDKVAYGFESATAFPKMEKCYTCHGETKTATNTCEACHISTVDLKPQSHKSVNFIHTHKFNAELPTANCSMCHDNQSCEECHIVTTGINGNNNPKDFYLPYSPTNFVDGKNLQKITRVHDLNYRFTHGIDLKGKETECQNCHQVSTFCVECHQSTGGDYALNGMLPYDHRQPNFVTIGVGTGGGEHAKLARRDIERCASCHDTQGNDPVCLTCHIDNDGIKGTNPKTHSTSFARDQGHGDWHTNSASICYNCHTDANARPSGIKGVGFCGYCHK